jgi:hypothetical protein
MRHTLHIVTKPDDALAREMIERQQSLPDHKIKTIDLSKPSPDYTVVIKEIFAADSIQVW